MQCHFKGGNITLKKQDEFCFDYPKEWIKDGELVRCEKGNELFSNYDDARSERSIISYVGGWIDTTKLPKAEYRLDNHDENCEQCKALNEHYKKFNTLVVNLPQIKKNYMELNAKASKLLDKAIAYSMLVNGKPEHKEVIKIENSNFLYIKTQNYSRELICEITEAKEIEKTDYWREINEKKPNASCYITKKKDDDEMEIEFHRRNQKNKSDDRYCRANLKRKDKEDNSASIKGVNEAFAFFEKGLEAFSKQNVKTAQEKLVSEM